MAHAEAYNTRVHPPLEPNPAESAGAPVFGAAVLAKALGGLLISGLLMALPGALLPVWRHHIDSNYLLVGLYFLVQNLGMLVAPVWAKGLLRSRGLAICMSLACGLAICGLVVISLFSPPSQWEHWAGRAGGLLLIGSAAGLMNMAVFRAASPAYRQQPAATINLGGVFYGVGCLLSALVVAGSYSVSTVPAMGLLLLILPAVACVLFARTKMPDPPEHAPVGWRIVARDLRTPSALLLALVLFLEFGNEGAIAGWLALFLTQKLGFSPARSLFLLALFWFALLAGRLLAQVLLPRVRHARMLLYSVLLGMFACLILAFTDNLFGVVSGTLMCGLAFACVLPLAMERIGTRFTYFHPGFYNGIFSIALTGGLLAPASIGLYAYLLGINVVMVVPLMGSVLVLGVVVLLFLESRFSAAKQA
jgi:FHS family glucose/mannose:H+ symporter-like MFS transporter